MEKNYFISLYLDTRRAKANNKYPVKLRVFTSNPRIQKLYPTIFEMTEAEFKSIWLTTKPRQEFQAIRRDLNAVEKKAHDTAKDLPIFTFEQFEKKLMRKSGEGANVFFQFESAIKRFTDNKQIGTSSNYKLSLKSIKEFVTFEKGKLPAKLHFQEITPVWLERYETYMVKTMGKSRTTLSMYVRALRTVFNNAISEKEIELEFYPFGRRKYQVPATTKVKKALTQAELKLRYEATPKTKGEQRAKDFWFFSYFSNGINMKDIAQLRYKDLTEDSFVFYRAKTINTSKADLKPVTVFLNDFTKAVIDKYGKIEGKPKDLVFSIISDQETEEVSHFRIKNFTSNINKNIKKFAKELEITSEISTYWARHSFATNALSKGFTKEFIGEALSHSNSQTTEAYFAGFEDQIKKGLRDKMMEF